MIQYIPVYGLMIKCRCAFGLKQETHLLWTCDRPRVYWEEFICCQLRDDETISKSKRQFSVRNRNVLMKA